MRRLRWGGTAALAACALAALPAAATASVQVGSSGWQWGNPLPQGNTLRAMSFAGATGYAVGDFGTLLKHDRRRATTWSGLLAGTFTNLTEVQAIDANAVFAGGGCVARRSTDGGAQLHARRASRPSSRAARRVALRGRSGSSTAAPASSCSTTARSSRTDNNGDTFAQKNRAARHARAGRRRRSRST